MEGTTICAKGEGTENQTAQASYPHCLHEIVLPVVTLAPELVSKPVATIVEDVLEVPLVVAQVTPAAGTHDVAPEAAEFAPETTDVAPLAAVVVVGAGW